MEKMELYRKYRPNTLDEMVGNEATIKSLKKEMENGSHVFLMTGPAGCGKTTLARIMAKEVGAGPLSIHEINSAENFKSAIFQARSFLDLQDKPIPIEKARCIAPYLRHRRWRKGALRCRPFLYSCQISHPQARICFRKYRGCIQRIDRMRLSLLYQNPCRMQDSIRYKLCS